MLLQKWWTKQGSRTAWDISSCNRFQRNFFSFSCTKEEGWGRLSALFSKAYSTVLFWKGFVFISVAHTYVFMLFLFLLSFLQDVGEGSRLDFFGLVCCSFVLAEGKIFFTALFVFLDRRAKLKSDQAEQQKGAWNHNTQVVLIQRAVWGVARFSCSDFLSETSVLVNKTPLECGLRESHVNTHILWGFSWMPLIPNILQNSWWLCMAWLPSRSSSKCTNIWKMFRKKTWNISKCKRKMFRSKDKFFPVCQNWEKR